MQEPIEIKLCSRWVTDKKVKNSGNLIQKDDKFVYVPILQTLQQLINNDSIRKELGENQVKNDNFTTTMVCLCLYCRFQSFIYHVMSYCIIFVMVGRQKSIA